jgi:hypothetical protein
VYLHLYNVYNVSPFFQASPYPNNNAKNLRRKTLKNVLCIFSIRLHHSENLGFQGNHFIPEMSVIIADEIARLHFELKKALEEKADDETIFRLKAKLEQAKVELSERARAEGVHLAGGHAQLASASGPSTYASDYPLSCSAQAR